MIAHPHSSKQIYGLHYLPKFTADLTFTGQRPHRRQKEKDNLEASAAVENREQLQPLADPLSALDSARDELSITGGLGTSEAMETGTNKQSDYTDIFVDHHSIPLSP